MMPFFPDSFCVFILVMHNFQALLRGRKVMLLNTHLESMKEHSNIRIMQIHECFEQLIEWDDGKTVIVFGGDLNARDSEVKNFMLVRI